MTFEFLPKNELLKKLGDEKLDYYIFSRNLSKYFCAPKNDSSMLKKVFELTHKYMIAEHNDDKVNIKLDLDGYFKDESTADILVEKVCDFIREKLLEHYNITFTNEEYYVEKCKPNENKPDKNGNLKRSRHVTINSSLFYWKSKNDIHNFFTKIQLYTKFNINGDRIVDDLIYKNRGIRVAYSYKYDKDGIDYIRGRMMPSDGYNLSSFKLFKNCLMCYVRSPRRKTQLRCNDVDISLKK